MSERLFNADYRDMITCLQGEGVEFMLVDGLSLKVISLDDLIANKRASGRPKDLSDAMTLEKLKEKRDGSHNR